jgi:autotransporter translocation and assembly factor TamB
MRLNIKDGWVVVREIWLWKSAEERFAVRQCDPPEILRTKDFDGDLRFTLKLLTPNGRNLTLAEGHWEEVEATRDRLTAAMGTTPAAR